MAQLPSPLERATTLVKHKIKKLGEVKFSRYLFEAIWFSPHPNSVNQIAYGAAALSTGEGGYARQELRKKLGEVKFSRYQSEAIWFSPHPNPFFK
jgi:hypothetical protein